MLTQEGDEIKDQLIKHEGFQHFPYKCTAGYLTIGIGRNLETKGIIREEALHLLENDIDECIRDLKTILEWDGIDDTRKRVLIDMRFNLGHGGFRSFRKMIAAVEVKDYAMAAEEMKDSAWFKQTGYRALTLYQMMKGS